MSEHPRRERISALVDEPGSDPEAVGHVRDCAECRRELERMRKMRMALSALDDLEPPEESWDRIAASLTPPEGERGRLRSAERSVPLRAAAAVLLFAAGAWVGTWLEEGAGPAGGEEASPAGVAAEAGATGEGLSYDEAFARLERLRSAGPSPEEALRDPAAAAEHLTRLDALVQATRRAVRETPADPNLNDFLFEVVQEREALEEALQFATLEYR